MKSKTKELYKQVIVHSNERLSDFPYALAKVSDIIETRADRSLPPAESIEELMKRKPRYTFYVHLKNKSIEALPLHQFIYDKKDDATKVHRHYMETWINELIEPYRKKVASGRKLTLDEIDKCEQIQNMLKD